MDKKGEPKDAFGTEFDDNAPFAASIQAAVKPSASPNLSEPQLMGEVPGTLFSDSMDVRGEAKTRKVSGSSLHDVNFL